MRKMHEICARQRALFWNFFDLEIVIDKFVNIPNLTMLHVKFLNLYCLGGSMGGLQNDRNDRFQPIVWKSRYGCSHKDPPRLMASSDLYQLTRSLKRPLYYVVIQEFASVVCDIFVIIFLFYSISPSRVPTVCPAQRTIKGELSSNGGAKRPTHRWQKEKRIGVTGPSMNPVTDLFQHKSEGSHTILPRQSLTRIQYK